MLKKSIFGFFRGIAKKSVFLRKIMRKVLLWYRRLIFNKNTKGIKMSEKKVFFNSFNGKSYTCSPKAVYEYMLSDPKFADYEFIWNAENPESLEFLLQNPRTSIVKNRSVEYDRALASSKYWFCNYRLYDYIIPKMDQVYVPCQHCTYT